MLIKSFKNVQNLTKNLKINQKQQFNYQLSQQEIQEKQRQEEKANAQNNRLKFIILTASLGGGMLGYGLGTMIHNSEEVKKAVKQAEVQIDKIDTINQNTDTQLKKEVNGKWNPNWDGLNHLYVSEQQKKQEEKQNQSNSKSEISSNNNEQQQSASEQPTVTKKRGRRYITLVRHGQYEWADDDADRKLTKTGKEQAKMTGIRLKDLGEKYDKIYVSSMTRAKETSEIIKKELYKSKDIKTQIIEDSDLSEGFPNIPSPCQGETLKMITEEFSKEEQERINRAFKKYFKRIDEDHEGDSHELFIIHGNVIRYMLTQALQFQGEGWLRMATGNCGITQFIISPNGNVSLRRFGETGHLSPEKVTFN